jgi:tetratricopeptide (TPR) repeat protein
MDMANSALELSERYGFNEWLGYARMHRAYVLACQGDLAALKDLEGIVEDLYDGNSDNSWAHSLYTLAEAQLKCGNMHAALASAERAIAVCEKRVGRYIEPDCHRMRGELLILLGRQEAGIESLQRSLALARRDGAHYLTMRTLCSLIDHAPAADKPGFREALGAVLAQNIRGETPHIQAARSRLQLDSDSALRSFA